MLNLSKLPIFIVPKTNNKKIYKELKYSKLNNVYTQPMIHDKELSVSIIKTHLTIIRDAIFKKLNHIIIFEDNVKFSKNFKKLISNPPDNVLFKNESHEWGILHLGAVVHYRNGAQFYKNLTSNVNNYWFPIRTNSSFAYIINLNNKLLVNLLLQTFDLFLNNNLDNILNSNDNNNSLFNNDYLRKFENFWLNLSYKTLTYVYLPMICSFYKDDNLCEISIHGLRKPEYEIIDYKYVLKLSDVIKDDLPTVSISTITRNRRYIFSNAIRNFMLTKFNRNKLQWVIIDNSTDDSIKNILPPLIENNIKYVWIGNEHKTVGYMRNKAVEMADNQVIVNMDDDDYYPPTSVYCRVAVLHKYKNKNVFCVGSSEVGIYDLTNNTSNIVSDGIYALSEASLAFYKTFWENQKFNDLSTNGEYREFIHDRHQFIMDIPYSFIIIAMKHGNNTINKLSVQGVKDSINDNDFNFMEHLDDDSQIFYKELQKFISYNQPDIIHSDNIIHSNN